MGFLKKLGRNLLFLIVLAILLLIVFPEQMKSVYEVFGALFGPIVILMVIAAALPNKKSN